MVDTTIFSVAIRVFKGLATGILWIVPWMVFWLLCFFAISAVALGSGIVVRYFYQWCSPGKAQIHAEVSSRTVEEQMEERPVEIAAAVGTYFVYILSVVAMAEICETYREDGPATTTIAFGCMLAVLMAYGTIVVVFGAGCIIAGAIKYARLRTPAEVKVSENVDVRKKQTETKEKLSEWQPVEVMRSSAA
ncbi:hypothetical protein LTR56_013255 [Elasticomyces elasticus]|nr:hypothetical protein LTR56_013255 [Elasticomyces elasticus]KAK3650112.1 hypothetical protein LTR22_012707 [Elasticomyces elasticus]KAK4920051.1 hypothetical protein LTR49_012312 [Elasticomyces elasticus]KAK5757224.1 hypothetical protein LTS12_012740 [Elasticomyces elasticus]